jgi:hypothetical protein
LQGFPEGGGRIVPTLELTSEETGILTDVLEDYVSDLRMEIANTDSMEVRELLKGRESLLKDLLRRLHRLGKATSL